MIRTIQEQRVALKHGETHTITIPPETDSIILDTSAGDHAITIEVGEGATVTYCSITRGKATREAHLARDATIRWVDAAVGNDVMAHVTTRLRGEGAHAEFASIVLGKGNERYDLASNMVHEVSHTTSDMLTRAVMDGASRATYAGLIRIDHRAKGCDAYQKAETLLLSPDARMDAEPNLEIENEDVRCSHGVSLGRIDAEKLFYMAARGIPQQAAISMIIEGFFESIIAKMGEHAHHAREAIHRREAQR